MISSLEQKLLLEMGYFNFTNRRFDFSGQRIIKSQQLLCKYIEQLRKKGLVNICKNGRKSFYTLTDTGILTATLLSKHYDTNKIYWCISKTINWDFEE